MNEIKDYTDQEINKLGTDLINWLNEKTSDGDDAGNIFFEEFLYIKMDIHPDEIKNIANNNKNFEYLIQKAKKIQEIKLLKYSSASRLNHSMVQFILKNLHQYD